MSKAVEKKVREVAISELKSKCLSLVDQVNKTKTPLRITRRGKALADVVPVQPTQRKSWLGSMKGTALILGDIVEPVIDLNEIEAPKD
jgi:prevent-host-death family protein